MKKAPVSAGAQGVEQAEAKSHAAQWNHTLRL
jgi:hypothetical protein